MIRSVHCKINTLAYLRNTVGQRTSLLVYKTTILPVLEYSNVIFSLVPKGGTEKFQHLQNRALRTVFPLTRETQELHNLARLSTLHTRAENQLKCLMYRRAHHTDEYPILPTVASTRASHKIRFDIPRPSCERFKMFPLHQGAQLWDNLDSSTQKVITYQSFKILIKPSNNHPNTQPNVAPPP